MLVFPSALKGPPTHCVLAFPTSWCIEDYDLLLSTYEVVRNDREKFADAQTICFSGGLGERARPGIVPLYRLLIRLAVCLFHPLI